MTVRASEVNEFSLDRHLSLVGSDEYEYDECFQRGGGFKIDIVFQGKDVVKDRRALFAEIARRAAQNVVEGGE